MSSIEYLNKLYNSDKKLFKTSDIQKILDIDVDRTLEDIIKRFIDKKILIQLEKGKYILENSDISDFEIAQFLYSPSYISFETALNYHGILSQFPVEITSATIQKNTTKEIAEKIYSYSKLSTNLYTGYYKEGNSLIALPEKALFDQFYMITKGIKTDQYLDEMDYSNIKKEELAKYLNLLQNGSATSVNALISKYL